MLTRSVVAVTCALLAKALYAAQPAPLLEGALGLSFAEAVRTEHLGASLDSAPLDDAALASLLSAADLTAEHAASGWHHYDAPEIPRLLRDSPARYFVQIDQDRRPVQIVAEIPQRCDTLGAQLGDLITRKYRLDPQSLSVNAAFTRFQQWTFRARRAFIFCSGEDGWLSFLDPAALADWQRLLAQAARQQQALELKGRIVQANRFAHGNRRGLDGAFGVLFGAPFPGHEALPKDMPAPVAIDDLQEPFSQGQFELSLSPAGYPFRVGGRFPALAIEWAAPLLEAKFGTPQKRTSKHIIHKVGGDFAILKTPKGGGLEMVFISGDGQRAMRARADAAAEADWQDEVEGL